MVNIDSSNRGAWIRQGKEQPRFCQLWRLEPYRS